MRNFVRNTEREAKEDPMTTLATGFVLGASQAIEHQEATGQSQLVASDTIPKEGADIEKLKALGFQFPEEDTGDDLFIYAILPPGWTKKPTDHSLHSLIVDEKGRDRITVSYKAAFYDRWARMSFLYRYSCTKDYSDENFKQGKMLDERCFVQDNVNKERLFYSTSTGSSDAWNECENWLKENRPDYRNPLAYWDE